MKWFAVIFVLFAGVSVVAASQRVSSEISGNVIDASGAVIPGASITVTNSDIALIRTSHSDAVGHYSVQGLPPGSYSVRVEAPNFRVLVLNLLISVNEAIRQNISMQVGRVSDAADVREITSPFLETGDASLSGIVSEESLHALPLNGRDLFEPVTFQPGVVPVTNGGPNPWAEGGTSKAAVQGARPSMNNQTFDGGDINDPAFNIPSGGPSGSQLGVEAVKEVRVLLNSYGAEFGRNGGANVQFVSKSGSNDFHGSLYEYFRNSALDARNFFDDNDNPPLIRHQYGASLGGPIRRGKTFFFGNFEGLNENQSMRSSITVPDENARLGLLPSAVDPSQNVPVGINPGIRPFLDLYPHPTGQSLGNGVAVYKAYLPQRTEEDYFLLRVDHHMSGGDSMFVRYTFDDGRAQVPFQSTLVPGFDGRRENRNQNLMVNWQNVRSSNFINEVKFQFSRVRLDATTDNLHPLSISLVPNRPMGGINISGLPLLGNNIVFPVGSASNTFELIDNAAHQLGRNQLKYGVDFKRLQLNSRYDVAVDGQYRFADLSGLGIPSSSNNAPLEFFLKGIPLFYLGVDPQAADSNRGYRQNYFGLYMQDNWSVGPRLTINAGLRWEYWSNPSEVHDRSANIRSLKTDTAPTVGKIWESVPANLFSPRVGLVWSIGSGPSLVIRAGSGIFRDQLWGNLYSNTRFYSPFYLPVLSLFPNFLAPPNTAGLGGIKTPTPGSFGVTYQADFPYYAKYSLSVQKHLPSDIMLEVAYSGSRGIHLPRAGEANLTPQGPVNPNFGSLPMIATDANSVYNSLQLSITKRMARNFSIQAAYTLSKSVDDQSGVFPSDWVSESGVSQDYYNRTGDRARSSFDRRHVFVTNFVYGLPGLKSTNPFSEFLSDWQVTGIWRLMSGLPFTANLGSFNNSLTNSSNPADRPDLRDGADPCKSIIGTPEKWFDPTIFKLPAPGQYGNSGRNTLCGPDFASLDLGLAKTFLTDHKVHVQFRAEFLNALNRTNLSVPVNTQGAAGFGGNGDAVFVGRQTSGCQPQTDPYGCGIIAPDAGRIFSTAGDSRQIQFALKLLF